jgi:hypothetical protein
LRSFGGSVQLYADLPYAARAGWPGWVTGDAGSPEAGAGAWDRALEEVGLRLDAVTADVRELTPDDQERKRKALGGYRTQWKSLQMLRDELRFEVLFPVGKV